VLIYNHDKQMVGVDEETLKQIGYSSLAAFLEEHSDIADLFVKKPGYVHKFQNFSWIDFVRHADAEESKAIIMNGPKHFSCTISITPLFLTEAPDKEGFAVIFKHVRSMSGAGTEIETGPEDIAARAIGEEETELPLPSLETAEQTVLAEPDVFDIPDIPPLSIPDINPDGSLNIPLEIEEEAKAPSKIKPMLGDYINAEEKAYIDNLQTDRSYVYDPHIAADELGLPVELIEEFIGDFIQQAHEFKAPLFDAALKEDFDEVHILSHKLKGVAANLRVEDAFEVLSIINNSRDQVETEANLKQFYRIISKMEGNEVPELIASAEEPSAQTVPESLPPEEDDIYDLGFTLEEPHESVTLEEIEHEPLMPETPSSISMEEDLFIDFETPEVPQEPATPDMLAESAEPHEEIIPAIGDMSRENEIMPAPESAEEPLQYDRKKAALELDLKEQFVDELCSEFKQEAFSRKEALYSAIDTEDFFRVQAIAFEFKGIADNLRIDQISDSLKKLIRNDSAAAAKKEAERFYRLLEQI